MLTKLLKIKLILLKPNRMDKYLKNVLVVSFGFLLLFTAFGGLQSLQVSKEKIKCFIVKALLYFVFNIQLYVSVVVAKIQPA